MGQENYCNIFNKDFWKEGSEGIMWFRDEDTTIKGGIRANWLVMAWGGFTTGITKAARDLVVEPVKKVMRTIEDKWEAVTTWWNKVKATFWMGLTIGILVFISVMMAIGNAKKMGLPVDQGLRAG